MRVIVQQAPFATALDAVCKGISKDNTNAAYGGVLLDARDDVLSLTSMNVTRSIRYRIPADVEEPGVALLPGELLSKTVSKMPDMPVKNLNQTAGVTQRGKVIYLNVFYFTINFTYNM